MHNANIPTDRELPPTNKLIKSTFLAAIVASVLLVTVVMPAEYGIDPTGAGQLTGLKAMGEIKMSLAKEAAREKTIAENAAAPASTAQALQTTAQIAAPQQPESAAAKQRSDEVILTLVPNQGAEIKVTLKKGEKVNYKWSSTGKTNYDIHADSKELNIKYHGYSKGSNTSDEGVIEAAFNGSHGWFWRNRTSKPVTLTLVTSGDYTGITRME